MDEHLGALTFAGRIQAPDRKQLMQKPGLPHCYHNSTRISTIFQTGEVSLFMCRSKAQPKQEEFLCVFLPHTSISFCSASMSKIKKPLIFKRFSLFPPIPFRLAWI